MLDNKPATNNGKIEINQKLNVGMGVEIPALVPRLIAKKRPKYKLVAAQISKLVDFFYFSLYVLLVIRLLLVFFAENGGNGFILFIKNSAKPFSTPFEGIFPGLIVEFGGTLVFPIIIAFFFYMFLYLIINSLLTIFANRKTDF